MKIVIVCLLFFTFLSFFLKYIPMYTLHLLVKKHNACFKIIKQFLNSYLTQSCLMYNLLCFKKGDKNLNVHRFIGFRCFSIYLVLSNTLYAHNALENIDNACTKSLKNFLTQCHLIFNSALRQLISAYGNFMNTNIDTNVYQPPLFLRLIVLPTLHRCIISLWCCCKQKMVSFIINFYCSTTLKLVCFKLQHHSNFVLV